MEALESATLIWLVAYCFSFFICGMGIYGKMMFACKGGSFENIWLGWCCGATTWDASILYQCVGLSRSCCASNVFRKTAGDGLSCWGPVIRVGEPDGVFGFWLLTSAWPRCYCAFQIDK